MGFHFRRHFRLRPKMKNAFRSASSIHHKRLMLYTWPAVCIKKVSNDAHARPCANSNPNPKPNPNLGLVPCLGLDKKSWLHHWCTLKPGAGYGSPISCNSTRPFVVEHLPTLITCRFRYRASSGLIILPSRYGHCTSEKQCLYTTILWIVRVSYITKHLAQWLRFRPDGTVTFFLRVPSIVMIV